MDEKGFISIEYLFSIFIILIIASGLLFFTQATIESNNNIESNVEHRLVLDNLAGIINQVNSHGEGYSAYVHMDSKIGNYEITVSWDKVTMKYSNRKGETSIMPLKMDCEYKLYSGESYWISKTENGKIVIE